MSKISLSLALIEPKTVYIRKIKQKGLLHGGPAVIFAPKEAWEVINNTTFVGWDWLQEKYSKYRTQLYGGWHKHWIWAHPGYSGSLETLIDNLHSNGFKVNYDESLPAIEVEHALMEIGLTPDHAPNAGAKTKKIYKERTESSKELYPRTRFLWKEHHTRFNDWETKFVKSIGQQLKENKALTDRQREKLYDMFEKFKVPKEATASSEIGKILINLSAEKELSAEEKIRDAWDNTKGTSLLKWYPVTVTHNGNKRDFLVMQKKLSSGRTHAALHIAVLIKGRLMKGDDLTLRVRSYVLDGKNALKEEGISVEPSKEFLQLWKNAGFAIPH